MGSTGSRHSGFSSCGSQALEHRLGSCGARAQLLRGMWDLPGPGIEPVSPALAGRFISTVPPGRPMDFIFIVAILFYFVFSLQNCFSDVELIDKRGEIF